MSRPPTRNIVIWVESPTHQTLIQMVVCYDLHSTCSLRNLTRTSSSRPPNARITKQILLMKLVSIFELRCFDLKRRKNPVLMFSVFCFIQFSYWRLGQYAISDSTLFQWPGSSQQCDAADSITTGSVEGADWYITMWVGSFAAVSLDLSTIFMKFTNLSGIQWNWLKIQFPPPDAAGEIRVYVEHEDTPILKWTDPNPLPVKYVGFRSYGGSLNRFFFNCPSEQPETQSHLQEACRNTSVAGYNYDEFIPINSADQRKGFIVYFTVYVIAANDAHILLTPSQTSDGDVYEIGEFERKPKRLRSVPKDVMLFDQIFSSWCLV